jgi:hypothetical protein
MLEDDYDRSAAENFPEAGKLRTHKLSSKDNVCISTF